MVQPAQSLAGFLEPRDPRLGLGLMCKEPSVRQGVTEMEVGRWARGKGQRDGAEEQRSSATRGAEAWARKRRMPEGGSWGEGKWWKQKQLSSNKN